MCSPAPGPDTCCICHESIAPDQHAIDLDGDAWDVHTGECATQAGITETSHPRG